MLLEKLLSMIKCKRTYLRKSDMCSGNAYKITLSYKGHWCSFIFHDNYKNESKKSDFLYCLVLDAQAYENSRDAYEFMSEFGYKSFDEARKVRNACEKQYERLHRLFNQTEIDILSTIE